VLDGCIINAGLAVVSAPLRLLWPRFPGLASALGIAFSFAVSLLYAAALEWLWRGQTLGKRVLGLRVVDAHGLPLTPGQVLTRNLLRVVDALPFFYLVGGAACLVSRREQRLGDRAAATVVVETREASIPDISAWQTSRYNSFRQAPHLALRLRQTTSPEEAGLVLEALARRAQLDTAVRERLYAQLAEHFQERVPFPAEIADALSPEQYLRNLAGILFARQPLGATAKPGPASTSDAQ